MKRVWPWMLLLPLGLAVAFRPGTRIETTSRPVVVPVDPDSNEPVLVTRTVEKTEKVETPLPEPPMKEEENSAPPWLRALMRRQHSDGSWGEGGATVLGRAIDNVGITSLAILAFLSAGYTHLSQAEIDGRRIGDAVRDGLEWILAQPTPGVLDQALAALAISEAFGITGSSRWEASAQKAIDALAQRQASDGSWSDPVWSLFGAFALKSAEVTGLTFARALRTGAADHFRRSLEARSDVVSALGFVLLHGRKDVDRLRTVLENASTADPAERYLWTLLAQQIGVRVSDRSQVPPESPIVDVAFGALRDLVDWRHAAAASK